MAKKTKTTKDAIETAKTVAETAAEKVTEAVEKVVEKAEPVVAAAKSAATKATKKVTEKAAPEEKISTKVVIELADKSASADTLISRAKDDWSAKGNSLDDMKALAIYVNANEGMVYYVVNDDYLSGSFAI